MYSLLRRSIAAFCHISVALFVGLGFVLHSAAANATGATCNPSTYGVNPGTVNPSSFQTMLTACAADTIQFAAGTYTFAPTGTGPGFTVPGGTAQFPTVLVGNAASGSAATIFKVANSGSYDFLLKITDVSNVSIKSIQFQGSTYAAACTASLNGFGNAIGIHSTGGGTSSVENITLQSNSFVNFNGISWVGIAADNPSPGVGIQTELPISLNTFDSTQYNPGNCIDNTGVTTDSTVHAYMVDIGSTYTGSGPGKVSNVSVASNTFYADHVKGAAAIWANASRISVQNNSISNAGRQVLPTSGWSKEQGRYAIIAYDLPHGATSPDTVWVYGNTITNPVSAGVYVAGATNMQISHNTISGQTDTLDALIPKGAIALNSLVDPTGSTTFTVDNNTLSGNYVGIAFAGDTTVISDTNGISVPANSFGMKVWPTANSGLHINNTTVTATATDGTATSVSGFGYANSRKCNTTIASNSASISNLKQIGWTATTSNPRSLSWVDASFSCPYHYYTDLGISITGVTRQATATLSPVAQTVFWPFLL